MGYMPGTLDNLTTAIPTNFLTDFSGRYFFAVEPGCELFSQSQ